MTAERQGVVGTVSVVIPTLNAEAWLPDLLKALGKQKPLPPDEVIIIDSESTDSTRHVANGFPKTRVETITNFSHGRARNMGVRLAQGEFIVLMSQDAVPLDEYWLCNLLDTFANPHVAAAFSRQVPRDGASPMEEFFLATHFPSSDTIYTQRKGHESLMFQRDVFFSNVSSAIRRSVALQHPFDESLIMSEDQQFARDVILAKHVVAYNPRSIVTHSHNYTFRSAVGRYFDSVYSLRQIFPRHSLVVSCKMGLYYLSREAVEIVRNHPSQAPRYAMYVAAKSLGTLLGHIAERIPSELAARISLHPRYWYGRRER